MHLPKQFPKCLSISRVEDAVRESMFGLSDEGFCILCGESRYGTEGDAREYPCEACDTPDSVFGACEIFMEYADLFGEEVNDEA